MGSLKVQGLIPHLSCTTRHVNVCFDIGWVLLKPNLSVTHGTAMDPALFKRMMRSHTWLLYYEGKLSWPEALSKLALEFDVDGGHIQAFVDGARASLAPITAMVQLVEALSGTKKLNLYCLSNASKEDHDYIITAFPDLFRNFKRVFYSAAVGICKPAHGVFHHFVAETGCKPSETIFIDDTKENVVAAEVLGFTSVLARDAAMVEAVNLVVYHLRTEEERISAARGYLSGKKALASSPSLTSDGIRVQVHFDRFVIAELLEDPSFLPVHEAPATGTFNFFPPHEREGKHESATDSGITNAFTHCNFPDDLDTTAVALSALYKFAKVDMVVINAALERMLATMTEDGLFQVYFDPLRPRVDHVVQLPICYLFHLAGQPGPVQNLEGILLKLLKSRAYLLGSLYYPLPETFLWHVARLAHAFEDQPDHNNFAELRKLVSKRVGERVGLPGSPLALALRVLACELCGVNSKLDRKVLGRMQNVDGSWDLCPFYTYNDTSSWIGNEVSSTAFALAALQSQKQSSLQACE